MREVVKTTARGLAVLIALPVIISFHVRAPLFGRNRALEGSTQLLGLVPGVLGQYVRRAFLSFSLAHVAPTATIGFGTVFSSVDAHIDDYVYIGPGCHVGLVHLERDVLIGAGVHLPSGPSTHGTADLSRPVWRQPGVERMVRVGRGAWIGNAAVVMANVGHDAVVGAGAVITRPLPPLVVAAGVPARIIKSRVSVTKAAV